MVASVKLTRGVPAVESFPTAKIVQCAQEALTENGDVILQYGPARGYAPLRSLLAEQAGVSEARVIVGQGSLQLQDFCARSVFERGSTIYVEEPSYDRAVTIFRRAGAPIVGFPLADDGIDPDAIAARLKTGERPSAFYIIPDFQNPSGSVMSLGKRQRLAELARTYGFYIIEDVPYRKLRYRGEDVPSLFELAPDRVFQMSSFSKLISPGLRVGYVIAPEDCAAQLARYAEDTYINSSFLTQAIVHRFIQKGWLEPNIASLKALYAPRLDAMLGALDEHLAGLATWIKPDGGFFIGMTLARPVHAPDLLKRGAAAGLELTDGRGFFAGGGGDTFVRLPFCALTPSDIATGVARLGQVIREL